MHPWYSSFIKKKRITIKRFDATLPVPEYKTNGAVAFDCHARESVVVEPGKIALIPLNVAVKPPKNHCVILAARSSFYKRGLICPNGIGVGDEDFCGDNDEWNFVVLNYTNMPVTVPRGDRVAQMLVLPYVKGHLREVKKMKAKTRGGFGTTGR